MRTPLKILFAWTMLTLMAYNIVGYFLLYFLSERENRIEMQEAFEGTNESELVLITFMNTAHNTSESFIRKNNHEIIVEGKIYDVKNEYTKNGTTYFYCINDSKEEQLNEMLSNTIQSSTASESDHPNTTKFSFNNILSEFIFSKNSSSFSMGSSVLISSFIIVYTSEGADEIIPPPPRA